jgi:hypothetical protein
VNQWSSWKVPEAFVQNATGLFNFKEFSNFSKSQGLTVAVDRVSAYLRR